MRTNNIIITRGLVGQIASFFAATGLLAIVIAFLWRNTVDNYVLAAGGVALAGILVWAIATPDEFKNFITGRQVRYGTSAILSTVLLLGIVVMIYIFLERAVITVDMTQSETFTLDRATLEVLEGVRRPIQITGFYSPRKVSQREVDDQFLRLYETATDGLITRNYIDPEEEPAFAQTLRAEDGNLFISYLNEDGNIDFNSLAFIPQTGTQERDITQAISRLLISGTITVYFDLSLGELDPLDNTGTGLSNLNALLQENGLLTQPLNLQGLGETSGEIPLDANVIIMARPRIEPSEATIELLRDYLDRGGSLFILADTQSEFMTGESRFNQFMWDNYGLRMLDAVVVDPASSGATDLDIISFTIFDSQISAGLDPEDPDSNTQFRIARPVEVNDDPPVPNGRIIMSSEVSYAEFNLVDLFQNNEYSADVGEDLPGPFTTVAFADNRANSGGRIILIGDADFITNGQISSPFGNAYLFTDGLGWLTDFNEQVTFEPSARITNIPTLFISAQELDQIAFVTVVLMPGIVLLFGFAVWFRRSRR
ncbi:MAG: Gldg family protein [Aggregatilineales bacterium]